MRTKSAKLYSSANRSNIDWDSKELRWSGRVALGARMKYRQVLDARGRRTSIRSRLPCSISGEHPHHRLVS